MLRIFKTKPNTESAPALEPKAPINVRCIGQAATQHPGIEVSELPNIKVIRGPEACISQMYKCGVTIGGTACEYTCTLMNIGDGRLHVQDAGDIGLCQLDAAE